MRWARGWAGLAAAGWSAGVLPRPAMLLGAVMWIQAPTPMGRDGQDLPARLAASVGAGDLPGRSVAVVQGDDVVAVEHFGDMDLAGAPVDDDTVFLWMSMSTIATAVVVQQMAECGQLSLDDPAVRYVPALGAVVEAVDGRTFEQVVEAELLAPLGMRATAFELPESAWSRIATGTVRRGSLYHLAARLLMGPDRFGAPARGMVPLHPHRISGAAYGGLLGPARDVAQLVTLLTGSAHRDVLSPGAAAAMRPAEGAHFGLVVMSNASGGAGPVHDRVLRAADVVAEACLGVP